MHLLVALVSFLALTYLGRQTLIPSSPQNDSSYQIITNDFLRNVLYYKMNRILSHYCLFSNILKFSVFCCFNQTMILPGKVSVWKSNFFGIQESKGTHHLFSLEFQAFICMTGRDAIPRFYPHYIITWEKNSIKN